MARGKRTVRASEIGSFIFCRRAWWYQRQDEETLNQAELAAGSHFHSAHAGRARMIGTLKVIAWGLIFAALAFLSIYLSIQYFG